jgi:uncharacterized protein (UPF0276 family)
MYGMGLRHRHFPEILARLDAGAGPGVDFFEVITENFYQTRGRPWKILEAVRARVPVTCHGVSLSIAGHEGLDRDYLARVREFCDRLEPLLVSDHLCWTGLRERNLHNLLPFPYTEETLNLVARQVDEAQELLGRPLLLENLSAYLSLPGSKLSEAHFLRELHLRTGCALLLDLNNVFVNARNQNFDPNAWISEIPAAAVREVHLAGCSDAGTHLFDTHSCPVWGEVWELYRRHRPAFAEALTLVEWDEEIPSYETVLAEVDKARHHDA